MGAILWRETEADRTQHEEEIGLKRGGKASDSAEGDEAEDTECLADSKRNIHGHQSERADAYPQAALVVRSAGCWSNQELIGPTHEASHLDCRETARP
jgi:hypothetical protein